MRTTALFGICLLLWFPSAFAASPFEPKPSDVCSKSPANPKVYLLDARKLVGQLLEKSAGISSIDLDQSGSGVVFPDTSKALLDPAGFCAKGRCSTQTQSSLGIAFVSLKSYIDRHASTSQQPPSVNTSHLNSGADQLRSFLLGLASSESVCVLSAPAPTIATPSPNPVKPVPTAGIDWTDVPHYFSLRQNVEDLPIPQTDSKFKGLKQASLSWTQDDVAKKSSFALDLAAGYTVGRFSLDETGHYFGQTTGFATYDQQFVQTSDPTKSSRAQNVGFGVMGDLTLPTYIGSGYQNVAFYPKYVQSIANDSRLVSGNFVYTPMYGISGIDNVLYLWPELLSFQLTPKFKTVVQDDLASGTDIALQKVGSYYWYGPQIALALYGEGLLDGFAYTASYEHYDVVGANLPKIYLFQTALNYDFGKSKLVSLQLAYKKGVNLDTLEAINQVTLGLGVKY